MAETCWRSECRTGCYYPDVCSERPTAAGQGGLTEVLAAHRLHASMNICTCRNWQATTNAGSLRDQHDAHVAAVLTARLSEPDVVEAAAEAMAERQGWIWGRLGRSDRNVYREQARAALAAATGMER